MSCHVTQFYQAFPHVSTASDKCWGETWVRGYLRYTVDRIYSYVCRNVWTFRFGVLWQYWLYMHVKSLRTSVAYVFKYCGFIVASRTKRFHVHYSYHLTTPCSIRIHRSAVCCGHWHVAPCQELPDAMWNLQTLAAPTRALSLLDMVFQPSSM